MKKYLDLIVMSFIILAIVGVWFLKNADLSDNASGGACALASEIQVMSLPTESRAEDANFALNVSDTLDYGALAAYGLPIVVNYGSHACSQCRKMFPALEKVNKEFLGRAFIKYADIRKYPQTAQGIPLKVIPTQALFHADGTPFVPGDALARKFSFEMIHSKETGAHVLTLHQGRLSEADMRLILAEMGVSDDR